MIYPYFCTLCRTTSEIVKPVAEWNKVEHCTKCQTPLQRVFTRTQLCKTAVQEKKYQPSIGAALTDREMRQVAKDKGWVEVGNEKPEKHLKVPRVEYPTFSSEDIRALTSK